MTDSNSNIDDAKIFVRQIYLNAFIRVSRVIVVIAGITSFIYLPISYLKGPVAEQLLWNLPVAALVTFGWRTTYVIIDEQRRLRDDQKVIGDTKLRILNSIISVGLLISLFVFRSFPNQPFLMAFHFLFANVLTLVYLALFLWVRHIIKKWNSSKLNVWPFTWF